MVGGGVVHHEVDDDVDAPLVGRLQEGLEVLHGTVLGIDGHVVCHVVFVIAGGGHDGHEPDARAAQVRVGGRVTVVDVVQPLRQALEVANAVAVAVVKAVDEDLVAAAVVVVDVLGLGLVVLAHDAQGGGDVLLLAAAAGEGGAQGQRRQKQGGPSLLDRHSRSAAAFTRGLPPYSE